MEQQAVDRLEAKSAEEAIIDQIAQDFNLAPFMAKTQFEQMGRCFERYLGLDRDVGEMTFLAVSAEEPPPREERGGGRLDCLLPPWDSSSSRSCPAWRR